MIAKDLSPILVKQCQKVNILTLPFCVSVKRSPHIINKAFTSETSDSECATNFKSVSNSVKVAVLKISSACEPPNLRSALDPDAGLLVAGGEARAM